MLRLLPLLYVLLLSQASLSQQAGTATTNDVPDSCPVTKPYHIRPAFLFRPRHTSRTQARALCGLERIGCGLTFPQTERGKGWGTIRLATQPSDKSSSGGGKAMTGVQSQGKSDGHG
jgi:hypothetical protein